MLSNRMVTSSIESMGHLNLLTTQELATHLRKPASTVRRLARTRMIPSIRLGWRTRLYDAEAVGRALEKLTVREL